MFCHGHFRLGLVAIATFILPIPTALALEANCDGYTASKRCGNASNRLCHNFDEAVSGILIDHRARMEDVATGRWLTRDPPSYSPKPHFNRKLPKRKGSSQQLFLCCDSNPIRYHDPAGLDPRCSSCDREREVGPVLGQLGLPSDGPCCDPMVNITVYRNSAVCQPIWGHTFVCIVFPDGHQVCTGSPPGYPTPIKSCTRSWSVCRVCEGEMWGGFQGSPVPCDSVDDETRSNCLYDCLEFHSTWLPVANCISWMSTCLSRCCMTYCDPPYVLYLLGCPIEVMFTPLICPGEP